MVHTAAETTPRKLLVDCPQGMVQDPRTGACGEAFQVVQDEDSDIIAKAYPSDNPTGRRLLHVPFKPTLSKTCSSISCCSKRAVHLATKNGCLPCAGNSCAEDKKQLTTVKGRNGCICKIYGSCPIFFNNKCHKLPGIKISDQAAGLERKEGTNGGKDAAAKADGAKAKGKGKGKGKALKKPKKGSGVSSMCGKKACCDSARLAAAVKLGCKCAGARCKEGSMKMVSLQSTRVRKCKCVFRGSCPVWFSKACKVAVRNL